MEKEKPYKCDVCGKRYKNLNGLKYVSIPKRSSLTILLTATAQTTLTALQSRNEAQWPPPSSRPQQYQRRHQRQRPRPPRHRRGRHALTSPRDEHNINTSSRNFGPKTASNGFSCIISLLGHSSCICAALQTRTHDTPRAAAPRSRAGDATIKVEALTLRPMAFSLRHTLAPPTHGGFSLEIPCFLVWIIIPASLTNLERAPIKSAALFIQYTERILFYLSLFLVFLLL